MKDILEQTQLLLTKVRLAKFKAVNACNYQDASLYREYEKQVMAMQEHMRQFQTLISN